MINGNEHVALLICQKRSIMLNTPGMSQNCPWCCVSFLNSSGGKLSIEGATLPHAEIFLLVSPVSLLGAEEWPMLLGGGEEINLENKDGNYFALVWLFCNSDHFTGTGIDTNRQSVNPQKDRRWGEGMVELISGATVQWRGLAVQSPLLALLPPEESTMQLRRRG